MTDKEIQTVALSIATALDAPIDFVGEYELFLKELLRRFCLVEKSRIQEEYQKAQAQIKDGRELDIHVLVTLGGAKESLLESLFPDLGKEVES